MTEQLAERMTPDREATRPTATSKSLGRRIWTLVKWGLFALILYYVGKQGWSLIADLKSHPIHFRPGWFLAAIVVATFAWLPSMWYWRRLMVALGSRPSWWQVARAYMIGHLGKFAPGKLLVIAVRVELIRGETVRPAVAAYTVAYESLAYMASGAVAAAMLIPWILADDRLPKWASALSQREWKIAVPAIALIGSIVALMQLSDLFSRLAKKRLPSELLEGSAPPRLSKRLCLVGLGPLLAAWWLHGLVLGLTIQSFSDKPFTLVDWPLWTAANALAMVGGFVAVFAPGGLGVREALFIDMLEPHMGHEPAILAALLVRLAGLASDVIASGVLYLMVRPPVPARQAVPEAPVTK